MKIGRLHENSRQLQTCPNPLIQELYERLQHILPNDPVMRRIASDSEALQLALKNYVVAIKNFYVYPFVQLQQNFIDSWIKAYKISKHRNAWAVIYYAIYKKEYKIQISQEEKNSILQNTLVEIFIMQQQQHLSALIASTNRN